MAQPIVIKALITIGFLITKMFFLVFLLSVDSLLEADPNEF